MFDEQDASVIVDNSIINMSAVEIILFIVFILYVIFLLL